MASAGVIAGVVVGSFLLAFLVFLCIVLFVVYRHIKKLKIERQTSRSDVMVELPAEMTIHAEDAAADDDKNAGHVKVTISDQKDIDLKDRNQNSTTPALTEKGRKSVLSAETTVNPEQRGLYSLARRTDTTPSDSVQPGDPAYDNSHVEGNCVYSTPRSYRTDQGGQDSDAGDSDDSYIYPDNKYPLDAKNVDSGGDGVTSDCGGVMSGHGDVTSSGVRNERSGVKNVTSAVSDATSGGGDVTPDDDVRASVMGDDEEEGEFDDIYDSPKGRPITREVQPSRDSKPSQGHEVNIQGDSNANPSGGDDDLESDPDDQVGSDGEMEDLYENYFLENKIQRR